MDWLEVAGFSEHQGRWLYSLLACLEKPLTPELCDNVRKMVLLCARVRAELVSDELVVGKLTTTTGPQDDALMCASESWTGE